MISYSNLTLNAILHVLEYSTYAAMPKLQSNKDKRSIYNILQICRYIQ